MIPLRDHTPRKHIHRWEPLKDTREPNEYEALYIVRHCSDCKARQHAVLYSDVWRTTPACLWHIADAGWSDL